jgi:hypothetical protein
MGRIIPAGTGFSKYRGYEMGALDKTEEPIPEEQPLLEGATP